MEELGLARVHDHDGLRYVVPGNGTAPAPLRVLKRLLEEFALSFTRSDHGLVVRTPPGAAAALAEGIDRVDLPEVAGTIAGDNTILILGREGVATAALERSLNHIMEAGGMKRAVLAYSGGLDTSVTIRWLVEQGYEVQAVAVDVGQQEDFDGVVERGRLAGAADVRVVDAVDRFAADYLVHAIKANGLYEGKYPMVSGLARPLIVEEVVKVAREIGADVVAHGCTGKGNDQVRFEVSFGVLAPDLEVLAPIRDANIPREKALVLAEEWGIPLASIVSSYSVDENLWGRTAECGPLEDPWVAPPEDAFARTAPIEARPSEPAEIVVAFERGLPVALDGDAADLPSVIRALDLLGGTYGFGRVDMIENRRVGIKSRELYEVPGALAIILAHRALEDLTLEREVAHHKPLVEQRWTDLVYDGQWFSPLRDRARRVRRRDADPRDRGGAAAVRSRARAPSSGGARAHSLYDLSLATYGSGDAFDQSHAEGTSGSTGCRSRCGRRSRAARERGRGRRRRFRRPPVRRAVVGRPVHVGSGAGGACARQERALRRAARSPRRRRLDRARAGRCTTRVC